MKRKILLLLLVASSVIGSAQENWTAKAPFPPGGRWASFSFSIGNKGYIGTGVNNDGAIQADNWEYDPATDSWMQKADFGGGIRYLTTSFSVGGKGYVGTGVSGSYLWHADMWAYDPAANTWSRKNDFPGGPRLSAVAFTIGSKAYMGTGNYRPSPSVDATYLNDFYEYNPLYDTWSRKSDVPEQGRTNAMQ